MTRSSSDDQSSFYIDPIQKEFIDLDEFAKALILIAQDAPASRTRKRSKARKTKQADTKPTHINKPSKKGEES